MENQSKALLVLGNGFDKSFGLKTGYNDYLSSQDFTSLHRTVLHGTPDGGLIQTLHARNTLDNWVDVELAIKEFALSNSRNTIGINHAKYIKTAFGNLKASLTTYLNRIVKESTLPPRSSFFNFASKIFGKPLDVINFNYTDTFELISLRKKQEFSLLDNNINVHGTLEQDNIIFGIDGIEKREISENITFLEKEYEFHYQPKKIGRLLKQANEIFFFGVSLGETDKRYYEPFFKELLNSEIERKLYFSFYGEESKHYIYNRIKDYTSNQVHQLKSKHDICFYDCENSKFC